MREIQVYTLARHKRYLILQRGWSQPVWIKCEYNKWFVDSKLASRRLYGGDVVRICTEETHPEYYL